MRFWYVSWRRFQLVVVDGPDQDSATAQFARTVALHRVPFGRHRSGRILCSVVFRGSMFGTDEEAITGESQCLSYMIFLGVDS